MRLSGKVEGASHIQWRDRAGISPASLLCPDGHLKRSMEICKADVSPLAAVVKPALMLMPTAGYSYRVGEALAPLRARSFMIAKNTGTSIST